MQLELHTLRIYIYIYNKKAGAEVEGVGNKRIAAEKKSTERDLEKKEIEGDSHRN